MRQVFKNRLQYLVSAELVGWSKVGAAIKKLAMSVDHFAAKAMKGVNGHAMSVLADELYEPLALRL